LKEGFAVPPGLKAAVGALADPAGVAATEASIKTQ
jgi:hypothetical protein